MITSDPPPAVPDDVAIVEARLVVAGHDAEGTGSFPLVLAALVDAGVVRLQVDLAGVDGGDARRLLSALAAAQDRLHDHGGRLEITGVPSSVLLEALRHASLAEVFLIHTAALAP